MSAPSPTESPWERWSRDTKMHVTEDVLLRAFVLFLDRTVSNTLTHGANAKTQVVDAVSRLQGGDRLLVPTSAPPQNGLPSSSSRLPRGTQR